MKDRTPYVYLIGWSTMNMWYYGVRYAKGCDPKDLFNPYRTSSHHVKKYIDENGIPDVIEIRKTFENVESARNWEHKVLKRMRVIYRHDFINKTDNKSITKEGVSVKWSLERRQRFSEMKKGKPSPAKGKVWSDEAKKARSELRKGKTHSEETKRMMSVSQKNRGGYGPKIHSLETKQKMSESHKKHSSI